jgi:hypothetical protein
MVKLALFLLPAALLAQPLSQGDRSRALSELYATAKMFTDSVANLTPAQWNFKAAPDRWSIAECAEHITLTEDLLSGMVQKVLKDTTVAPDKKVKDEQVLKVIADRSRKATAPEVLQPNKKFPTPAAIVEHFTESRNKMLDYVRTTQDDLRAHFAAHPALGAIDAYQWILLMAAHTDRHVQQIQEVKAAPGYPR